jgi:hypothetical protein
VAVKRDPVLDIPEPPCVAVEREPIFLPLSQWPVDVLRAECQRLGLVDTCTMNTLGEGGCLALLRKSDSGRANSCVRCAATKG